MITITCDICRKKIDDAFYGRTFFYYANFSICEPCKDALELSIKQQVRTREPYATDWYEKYIRDTCGKAVQKGKA